MAIFITGGAGFIGGQTALACLGAGHRVVVLDDLSRGGEPPPGVTFVQGDVGDQSLVAELLAHQAVDTVLHLAALTDVGQSFRAPFAYYRANAGATANLVAACVEAGVSRFVLSSTAAVYAEGSDPVAEDAPLAPASPYATSKAMAERMLGDIAGGRMAWAVLRYFNVAGADPRGRRGPAEGGGHLMQRACEVALGRARWLDIYGDDFPTPDGSGVRDFVHVEDIATAHLAVLDRLGAEPSLTLNLGSGCGYSVCDVVRAVETATGQRLPARIRGRRAGDAACSLADVTRARAAIGWRARHGLDAMVAHTLAFERARFEPAAGVRRAG